VAGSIILAGVLLKLGGYGVIRVLFILKCLGGVILRVLIGLRLLRMVYVGLICCRLNDFKALVAYSSVAHMGIVIIGRIIMNL
jgi:NADH-ubiquinone oxidoreductase chain 4